MYDIVSLNCSLEIGGREFFRRWTIYLSLFFCLLELQWYPAQIVRTLDLCVWIIARVYHIIVLHRFFLVLVPKGRLLTSAEGCGMTKVTTNRIVGGSDAKPGAWPWIAQIGYRSKLSDKKTVYLCGKISIYLQKNFQIFNVYFICHFQKGGSLITSRYNIV